ncbi:hypothetical protein JOB18_001142 [Solea senegalensis]|uniref:Selenoprotein P N-terminal domain-containing protein n=1 Tax=Solea senegalensis TaxID=28829 RepID=A0AAV6T2J1_SOLSE|nr:hypothetical protein JOB18_001142 [Solea senegalensis]
MSLIFSKKIYNQGLLIGVTGQRTEDRDTLSRCCQRRTMHWLPPLWLYAAIPGVLWAAHVTLLASKLGGLRDRLNRSNITEVSFMIVNEREAQSRAMYWGLKRRAPPDVPVYQQAPFQDDVWEALDGDKDDFLVYDRCGFLTFHVVLPYSFLHQPYVEAAIRATYQKDICNCHQVNSTVPSVTKNETTLTTNHTTTLPTIHLDSDNPEGGDQAPVTHHHHHHHPHHHHHH